ATLELYRRRGQEWRIKPLAWTRDEMLHALRDSRVRMHTPVSYYHSVKGVHFLTFREFEAVGALLPADPGGFLLCLREWVGRPPEQATPQMMQHKYLGHHEIEFFGLPVGEHAVLSELL